MRHVRRLRDARQLCYRLESPDMVHGVRLARRENVQGCGRPGWPHGTCLRLAVAAQRMAPGQARERLASVTKGKRQRAVPEPPCGSCIYAQIGGEWVLYLMHRLCPCHGDGWTWRAAWWPR